VKRVLLGSGAEMEEGWRLARQFHLFHPKCPPMRDRLERFWFGEDFFIAYARSDGLAYAAALANRLGALGYSCFLDQWQPIAGRVIPPAILRSLRRASTLVVVASPGAASSEPMAEEIRAFRTRNRPMIPIAFEPTPPIGGALAPLAGIAWSGDSVEALRSGVPADVVVNRIANTFEYRRRNLRVRWTLVAFTLGSVLLAGASGFLALLAQRTQQRLAAQARVAQENFERYTEAAAEAKRQADAAEERRRAAERAILARDSARVARDEAVRELRAAGDLVENRTVLLEFDRTTIGPNSRRVLIGLLKLIRDTDYAGRLQLAAHVASFCVRIDRDGAPVGLAPANLPLRQCRFWPATDEYALALSQRFGVMISAMAATTGLDASRTFVQAHGREMPRIPYPESGTAGQWNEVARQNNRVQLTFVAAGSDEER
jgi:TIR domain